MSRKISTSLSLRSTIKKKYAEEISQWISFRNLKIYKWADLLEHYMEPKERILQMVAENPGMPPFLVPNIGETVQGKNVVLSDKTEEAEIGDP